MFLKKEWKYLKSFLYIEKAENTVTKKRKLLSFVNASSRFDRTFVWFFFSIYIYKWNNFDDVTLGVYIRDKRICSQYKIVPVILNSKEFNIQRVYRETKKTQVYAFSRKFFLINCATT